jgi:hypothetical protein
MSDFADLALELWESKPVVKKISPKIMHRAKTSSTCDDVFEDVFGDSTQYPVQLVSVKGSASESESILTDMDLDTPVYVLRDFGLKFIKFFVIVRRQAADDKPVEKLPSAVSAPVSALDRLMIASRAHRYPTLKKDSTKAENRLYNDLVECIKSIEIGWTLDNVDNVGKKVVGTLAKALWFLTCHHTELADRGCQIPVLFAKFQDYNDHVKAHKRSPQVIRGPSLLDLVFQFRVAHITVQVSGGDGHVHQLGFSTEEGYPSVDPKARLGSGTTLGIDAMMPAC